MNFFNMLELDQSSTLKKILSIMKLTVVFLIAFSLQISASVYSQTTKLSLNVQNQSIKDVLYLIENQTDFRFIYESGKINLDKKVVSVSAMLPLFFKQEYLALSSKKDESSNSFSPYSRSLQGTFA